VKFSKTSDGGYGKASSSGNINKNHIRSLNLHEQEGSTSAKMEVDAESYAGYVRYQKMMNYNLMSIHGGNGVCDCVPKATVIVENSPVSFTIGTGSPINVIDEVTWSSIKGKHMLEECLRTFYAFKAVEKLLVIYLKKKL
jgi:hypothetical protein